MKVKMTFNEMVLTFVVGFLLNDVCICLPTARDQQLSDIIKDLETAVYKLKVYQVSRSSVGSEEDDGFAEEPRLDLAPERHVQRTPGIAADGEDISLQEALRLIADLAKQNKLRKRDHDIPFPLNPDRK